MKTTINSVILSVMILSVAGCEKAMMQSIHEEVAQDLVKQYNIAKRQGDKMQICVQAGLVSAAYLQAKDEAKYRKWKATEKSDCRAAGVPQ